MQQYAREIERGFDDLHDMVKTLDTLSDTQKTIAETLVDILQEMKANGRTQRRNQPPQL